jgi:putative ABC transport system permease protein
MGAVRAVARAELRSWRGIVVLGLLLGIVGGVVLAAVGLAERTRSAYPRLVAAVGLDDARVLIPIERDRVAAAVPALPGVAKAWVAGTWVARIDGPALRFVSVGAGRFHPSDFVRPAVVKGRAPHDGAADELLVSEPFAEASGIRVGEEITLRLLTPAEIGMFDVGFGEPDGGTARMRVVGIGRMPSWDGTLPQMFAAPAFARVHAADAGARAVFVRLTGTDPATRAAFAASLAAANAADGTPSELFGYIPPVPSFPTAEVDPAVRTAERVLVGGLAVFGVVLALGGLLVVGQGLLRHHAGRRATQQIELALGMTRAERLAARVLAASVGAAVAGVTGGAVAVAAGLLEPLGSQARFEPEPGFRAPWAIAIGGGLGLAALFLLLTAVTAAVAGTRPAPRPSAATARGITWGRRWPALLVGVRLAWRGRRGRGAGLPVTATVLGAAVAIAAIVATMTFGASLARLVETPSRFGHAGDLTLVDARTADLGALVADERVAAVDLVTTVPARLTRADARTAGAPPGAATRTDVYAYRSLKGDLPVETVSGREPAAPGEIGIGPRTANRLGVGVGDRIQVVHEVSGTRTLTVTGIVVVQPENLTPLGDAALVMPSELRSFTPGAPAASAHILAAPGQAQALFDELSQRLEIFPLEVPAEIRNLSDLLMLPEILAIVLALVAGAGVAHTLLTAARRNAHDVAVLAVLGGTPGQVRATLGVMAAATVLPALLLGVPLGLAVARVLWWEVATAIGVAGDLALPGPLLAAIVPAVLLAALLVALVPAERAARTPPATVLSAA